jgi:hypothetical protein
MAFVNQDLWDVGYFTPHEDGEREFEKKLARHLRDQQTSGSSIVMTLSRN